MRGLLIVSCLVSAILALPQSIPPGRGTVARCNCRDVICPNSGIERCQCLNRAAQDCWRNSRGICPSPVAQNCVANNNPYQPPRATSLNGQPPYNPKQPSYNGQQPSYNGQQPYFPQQPPFNGQQPYHPPSQTSQSFRPPAQPYQSPYQPSYRPPPTVTVTVTYNPGAPRETISTITVPSYPPPPGNSQAPFNPGEQNPRPPQSNNPPINSAPYAPPWQQSSSAPYVPPWLQTTSTPYVPPWLQTTSRPYVPPWGQNTPRPSPSPPSNTIPPWQPKTSDGPAWTPVPQPALPPEPVNLGPLPTPVPTEEPAIPIETPAPISSAEPVPTGDIPASTTTGSPPATSDVPSPTTSEASPTEAPPSAAPTTSGPPAIPVPGTPAGTTKCGPGQPACENNTYCDPQPLCSIGQDCPGVCLPILDETFSQPVIRRMAIWQGLLDSGEWGMFRWADNSTAGIVPSRANKE